MSEISQCLECAFMAWDRNAEKFFCARTPDHHFVFASQTACPQAVRRVYHKRRNTILTYQLELFQERR